MIAIAEEKHAAGPVPALVFRTATAEALDGQFDAVLKHDEISFDNLSF